MRKEGSPTPEEQLEFTGNNTVDANLLTNYYLKQLHDGITETARSIDPDNADNSFLYKPSNTTHVRQSTLIVSIPTQPYHTHKPRINRRAFLTGVGTGIAALALYGFDVLKRKRSIEAGEEVKTAVSTDNIPCGSPLGSNSTVITQGYGVGTHAPADIWGGVDLAIDVDGDGKADPGSTDKQPVYATNDGDLRNYSETWPGGNCAVVTNDQYETKYCHLNSFTSNEGPVEQGQQIGLSGSTGQSSGPHVHYEVWVDKKNTNPNNFNPTKKCE